MAESENLTVQTATKKLTEYRLESLALLKTLDRVGVAPNRLDASLMNSWADVDAECLQCLALLLPLPKDEVLPQHVASDMLRSIQRGEQIKQSLIESLPSRLRNQVQELLPVGSLVVDEQDVYDELKPYIK